MTKEEIRKKVQDKSKELGHCVCSNKFGCECPYFLENDLCKCSGEKLPISDLEWVKYNMDKLSSESFSHPELNIKYEKM